jgi:membrane protein DedA with SNARE-associated domain
VERVPVTHQQLAQDPRRGQKVTGVLSQRAGRGWLLAAIAMASCSYGGLIALPSLLGPHPGLLLALRPTPEVLLLVGHRVNPLMSLAIALPGRLLVHIIYFHLGRFYGEPILQLLRPGRVALRLLRHAWSKTILLASVLLYQTTPADVSLGILRTRPRIFLPVLGLGAAASTAVLIAAGQGLTDPLAPTTRWLTGHGPAITVALAALAAVQMPLIGRSWYRRTRGLTAPPSERD